MFKMKEEIILGCERGFILDRFSMGEYHARTINGLAKKVPNEYLVKLEKNIDEKLSLRSIYKSHFISAPVLANFSAGVIGDYMNKTIERGMGFIDIAILTMAIPLITYVVYDDIALLYEMFVDTKFAKREIEKRKERLEVVVKA